MISFVTGGARSGKSSFAEGLYKGKKDVVYMATSRIWDKEMGERVSLHRETRPKEWRTFEGTYNLHEAVGNESNYLLDCLTVLTSNILFDLTDGVEYIDYQLQARVEEIVLKEIKELIGKIREKGYNLILVTNEVGDAIVPDNHLSRVFRDIQGRVNQQVASLADEAYLVVAGIAVRLK